MANVTLDPANSGSETLIANLANQVLQACRAKGWMVATAESCTGGMIAAELTAIAGSSDVMGFGFVTYSNEAKMQLLGVKARTLRDFGAVSTQTAIVMAQGALDRSGADLAISVTGIAGPGGSVASKPVGTVCFGLASRHRPMQIWRENFKGDRQAVRQSALAFALQQLLNAANE